MIEQELKEALSLLDYSRNKLMYKDDYRKEMDRQVKSFLAKHGIK